MGTEIRKWKASTEKSENSKVVKAAGIVGAATMVSRVFGLVRDMVIAAFFGASWMTDAFWVAFRIPNMLRRLLGEGSLTISFVPVFTEYLEKKSKEEAIELASQRFYHSFRHSGCCFGAGHFNFTCYCRTYCARIYFRSAKIRADCISQSPDVSLYLFYRPGGFVHGYSEFLPAFYRTGPITGDAQYRHDCCGVSVAAFFAEPITALAVGVLIGGVLQLAMQWPFLLKFGVYEFKFRSICNIRALSKSAC